MKKILFFLSAVVMLIIVCVQTNSSFTDLLLENVEALSAGEVHLGYKRTTGPCPQPYAYKRWVSCAYGGDSKECLPSDC